MTVAILLLAAGASSRMEGRDKLLEPIDGRALLPVMVARALGTEAPVYVTLPDLQSARANLLKDTKATLVAVSEANHGMAASLRTGISALRSRCSAVMIVPADMPDLQTSDFKTLLSEYHNDPGAPILRATTEDGQPGHPVILPARYFPDVAQLRGDRGAAPILRRHSGEIRYVALGENRAMTDLDTVQDWEKWRKTNHDRTL